jgi:hypothetical protein
MLLIMCIKRMQSRLATTWSLNWVPAAGGRFDSFVMQPAAMEIPNEE